jgi:hypothetical protein
MKNTIIDGKRTLELIIVGDANWDYYYCDKNKQLYYVAKKNGCGSGWFGDLWHLQRVKRIFGFSYKSLTKKGKELGIDKF